MLLQIVLLEAGGNDFANSTKPAANWASAYQGFLQQACGLSSLSSPIISLLDFSVVRYQESAVTRPPPLVRARCNACRPRLRKTLRGVERSRRGAPQSQLRFELPVRRSAATRLTRTSWC